MHERGRASCYGSRVSFALRALVLLAAVTPLFVATELRPPWWQTLLAAMIGSAIGQVVVRATRGRRVAEWSVAAVAAVIVVAAGGWSFLRGARHDHPSGNDFLIVRARAGSAASLTWDDVRAVGSRIPPVDLAVPYLGKRLPVATADTSWNTWVVGTTPEYFELMALHVAAGDRFDAAASRPVGKVVVLGDTVAAQLFGSSRGAVGAVVRIGNTPFTIIGVLAHQGTSPRGQDLDDVALVPIETYTARLAPSLRFAGALLISAGSPGDLARVEVEVRVLLRERHRLAPGDDDDFVIRHADPG